MLVPSHILHPLVPFLLALRRVAFSKRLVDRFELHTLPSNMACTDLAESGISSGRGMYYRMTVEIDSLLCAFRALKYAGCGALAGHQFISIQINETLSADAMICLSEHIIDGRDNHSLRALHLADCSRGRDWQDLWWRTECLYSPV